LRPTGPAGHIPTVYGSPPHPIARLTDDQVNLGGAQFAARERRVPPERDAACCAKAGHCGDGDGGIDFLQNAAMVTTNSAPVQVKYAPPLRRSKIETAIACSSDRTRRPIADWWTPSAVAACGSCDGSQQELHGEEIEDQS
jgi:hypothetical protein